MKNVIELINGGMVEITEEGVRVISVSGKLVCFDESGNLLSKKKVTTEKPSWMKYFFLMGKKERELVRKWLPGVVSKTEKQADFLKVVEEALTVIDYDYRIATIEPSMDARGRLFYKNDEEVARGLTFNGWKAKGKEFAPEWGSDLANLYELFLWYAYRIAKGFWTLEYVCADSSSAGNYRNSPDASGDFEVSGKRKVGGFADGVGNTYKIVAHNAGFAACGGSYYNLGYRCPVADVYCRNFPDSTRNIGSGVLVLRGSTAH
ncbi:MAG: hypothetical protein J6M02_07210 [Clostridia bacterium]|nr:hypothetical protein [Clostridia bacterium]